MGFTDATASDTDKFARWHRGMLERGVYLAPSQYEAGFMSLAHTDKDIDHTIAMAKEVFPSSEWWLQGFTAIRMGLHAPAHLRLLGGCTLAGVTIGNGLRQRSQATRPVCRYYNR